MNTKTKMTALHRAFFGDTRDDPRFKDNTDWVSKTGEWITQPVIKDDNQNPIWGSYGLMPMLGDMIPKPGDSEEEIVRGVFDYAFPSSSIGNIGKKLSPGTLQHFIGPKAQGADLKALKVAKEMAEKGIDERQIWKETGWYKSPWDNMWKSWNPHQEEYILPHLETKADNRYPGIVNPHYDTKGYDSYKDFVGTQGSIIGKDYPQIDNYPLRFYIGKSRQNWGSFNPSNKIIEVDAESIPEFKPTLYHELQHAIQEIEKFSGGTSRGSSEVARRIINLYKNNKIPKEYKSRVDDIMSFNMGKKDEEKFLKDLMGYDVYKREGGEVEARLATKMMGTSKKDIRDIFPLDEIDVPLDELW